MKITLARLPSRDIIADSIESVRGYFRRFDRQIANFFLLLFKVVMVSSVKRVPSLALVVEETQAQHYDANIALPGCDKNMPGCVMAAARHNRPTIIVYGGTIQAGTRTIGEDSMAYNKQLVLTTSFFVRLPING